MLEKMLIRWKKKLLFWLNQMISFYKKSSSLTVIYLLWNEMKFDLSVQRIHSKWLIEFSLLVQFLKDDDDDDDDNNEDYFSVRSSRSYLRAMYVFIIRMYTISLDTVFFSILFNDSTEISLETKKIN